MAKYIKLYKAGELVSYFEPMIFFLSKTRTINRTISVLSNLDDLTKQADEKLKVLKYYKRLGRLPKGHKFKIDDTTEPEG